MGIADALINNLAKKISENLDAKISSRLAANDSRLENLNASVGSRLASADSRLDKLDASISSRLSSSDSRLNALDIAISTRLSATDDRLIGFGAPKLPVKTGYSYKAISNLASASYFYFKNQILADGDFGLKLLRQGSSTNQWVTLLDLNAPGYLFGLMIGANVSGTISLKVYVDSVLIIDANNISVTDGYAYVYLGKLNGYRSGTLEYTVMEPNLELPMLYKTLQIQIKCSNANILAVASYLPLA